jgi:8-oxo-dGTP diphosphatase
MSEERPTFPVGINALVIRDGKLLLGKRRGSAGEGQWGLPGGHLEPGENMIDTAARELREETSLEAQSFTFLTLVNDNDNEKAGSAKQHYLQVVFQADGVTGEARVMEPEYCSEWRWFPLDALPENIFFGHTKGIEFFLKQLPFGDSK